ncbi:MAG: Lpg1974 family pore-forming outer membrane protein [Acidobacteriota bacterium]
MNRLDCRAKIPVCRLLVPAVAVLVWLAAGTRVLPAEMHPDQDERGFYIGLTGFRDQISNLDFSLTTSTSGGEGLRLRLDRGGELRYDVGWLLPESQGSVSITYWEFVETQEGEKSTVPLLNLQATSFVIYDPSGPPIGRSAVEARVEILARSVDISYSRDFKSAENFRATWMLGLRWFRYEHRMQSTYFTGAGATLADIAIEEVESTGVGPRLGAFFQYDFTRGWGLAGGLGVATLFGDTDQGNVSASRIATPSELISFSETRNQSRTFTQVDLDLHVLYRPGWRTLDLRAGFRYSHWFDARARELLGAGDSFQNERVTFDGPYLRVGYRF